MNARLAIAIAGLLASAVATGAPLAFQGHLSDRGQPANGVYDLRLTVHRDAVRDTPLAPPSTFEDVRVVNGVFRIEAAFAPDALGEAPAWLALAVRDGSASGSFDAIAVREPLASAAIGACWASVGDSGTNPLVHFLGTTDQQPLVLRVANQQVARFEPGPFLDFGAPVTANVIHGASTNGASAGVRGATIAGGGVVAPGADLNYTFANPNRVTDVYSTISGGADNIAGNSGGTAFDAGFASVGGGVSNSASGYASTVSGGGDNHAAGAEAAVAGGGLNSATASGAAVAGGHGNSARGYRSVVVGGSGNVAAANYGIAAGVSSCAGGDGSFAGGFRATVRHGSATPSQCAGSASGDSDGDQGAFVWADFHDAEFSSSGPNQFLVRADGGAFFNASTITASSDDLTIGARAITGDADSDLAWRTRAGKEGRLYLRESTGDFRMTLTGQSGASFLSFGNGASLTAGGVFTNASSRSLKRDFAAIDARTVLEELLALPLASWRYRDSAEGRHLGPTAEDFTGAFGLGDGMSIPTVDADGVAFAAIQGLNAKLEAENAALRARLDALEAKLDRLVPAQ